MCEKNLSNCTADQWTCYRLWNFTKSVMPSSQTDPMINVSNIHSEYRTITPNTNDYELGEAAYVVFIYFLPMLLLLLRLLCVCVCVYASPAVM